jgi:hypothetical protein
MALTRVSHALRIAVVPLVSATAIAGSALLAHGLGSITPGTPAQVAALVAAAPSITKLPATLVPSLSNAVGDNVFHYYPSLHKCALSDDATTTVPSCVFGDKAGSKTIALWGDSHAYMWFPAVNRIAMQDHYKLVALFKTGCPDADIKVTDVLSGTNYPACDAFRTNMIARINRLDPSIVIMSEDFYTEGANKRKITTSQWTTALEATIKHLAPNIQKVVLGNTIPVGSGYTPECLAANEKAIQKCSAPERNHTYTAERQSEQTAVAAEKNSTYLDVIAWTCSSVCTAVIGDYVVYYSFQHLTATYDYYLSGVLAAALQPLL